MDSEIHYLSYDSDAIWNVMETAYLEAGGDLLYPGDEKEILLRGVQSIIAQSFAGIDNALRMNTLRYAVRDYLDIYGEKRNCPRIAAEAATAKVQITFLAGGEEKTIESGTRLTADGSMIYMLVDDLEQTGEAGTEEVEIICELAGAAGNGLKAGTEMEFLTPQDGISNVTVTEDASGGQDEEDDETYRERIRTYGLNAVTTGPATQYESAAKAVSSVIIDARAINEGDGEVGVYLLLSDESGAAAIIEEVEEALTPDDVRPLTDHVSVGLATRRPYTLNVQYTVEAGTVIGTAAQDAVDTYQEWQENTIGRAFNPDMLMSYLYQAGCSRVIFAAGSNFDGGTAEYTAIEANEYCKGTITLEAVSA